MNSYEIEMVCTRCGRTGYCTESRWNDGWVESSDIYGMDGCACDSRFVQVASEVGYTPDHVSSGDYLHVGQSYLNGNGKTVHIIAEITADICTTPIEGCFIGVDQGDWQTSTYYPDGVWGGGNNDAMNLQPITAPSIKEEAKHASH